MARVLGVAIALVLAAVVVSAHGDAVKVSGTVRHINGQSVTIQPTGKDAKTVTFTIAEWTEIDKDGNVAELKDLKVGDRVAVEIPKGKTEAESIKIGAAASLKPTTTPADHKHKG